MRFDIISQFPDRFASYLKTGLVSRAIKNRQIQVKIWDLKKHGLGRWNKVDDTPYGGGPGMILRVDVLSKAIDAARLDSRIEPYVILFSASGKTLNQTKLKQLAARKRLLLVPGYYEGIDQRAATLVDEEISLGDYVIMSGDPASLVILEGVSRLLPGVVGNPLSAADESFTRPTETEYPQYTRPRIWRGKSVPEILLSGDHEAIRQWRNKNRH